MTLSIFSFQTILNDNAISVKQTDGQIIVVTTVQNPNGQGKVYALDGVNNPQLTLIRNGIYTFDQSHISNGINKVHQIAFTDSTGTYFTTGVVSTGTPGQVGAKTVFTVPHDAPENLSYTSERRDGLGNKIIIQTPSDSNHQANNIANLHISDVIPNQIDGLTFIITSVQNPDGQGKIYSLNGQNKPELTLVRNTVYTFDQSHESNVTHQIAFKDSTGAFFTKGVVSTGTPGQAGAKTVFTVPNDAPTSLRYYCVAHGNNMGNTIINQPFFDTTPPTISISSNDSTLTVGETATISFTLSEPSTNFELGDITAFGGTLSNFSGSGISYTALFTPTPNSTTNGVVSVTSTKFTDDAGNNNTASNLVTMTVNTATVNSNNAPIAKTATLVAKAGTEGKAFSYTLDSKQFSDADKDALTISATLQDNSTLPSWLTFNPTTKKLTGTPGYAAADTPSITIKFTADDGRGGTTSSTMLLNISNKATITGTAKADTIVAGAGADKISGGLGNDTLTGGLGNDTFVFNTKLGSTNIDTITDFTSGDKIALAGSIFSKLKGDKDLSDNLYVQTIVGIPTRDDNAANDHLFYDLESGRLYYDADGYGSGKDAVQVAIIGTGGITLTANDFSIV